MSSEKFTGGAKLAYAAIVGLIYDSSRRAQELSEDDIGRRYCKSARTFRRHLVELSDAHLIEVRHRTGKASLYILCDPRAAELGNGRQDFRQMFVEKETNSIENREAPESIEPEPEVIHTEPTNYPQDRPRPDMTGVAQGYLIKGFPMESIKETVKKPDAPRLENRERSEFTTPAIAFLQKHFDRGASRYLFKTWTAPKILWAKREFERTRSRLFNPPGFIRHLLQEKITQGEAMSAANEVRHLDLKNELRAEDLRDRAEKRRARVSKSLSQWLAEQPDAEALRAKAQAEARAVCGTRSDFQTVYRAVQGALWNYRKKQDRNIFRG